MTADEVAAKARDILRPILPDGGERLIALCLEEPFTPSLLAEACAAGRASARRSA